MAAAELQSPTPNTRSGDPPCVNTNGPPNHKEVQLLMASADPTGGERAVPLSLPAAQANFLREELSGLKAPRSGRRLVKEPPSFSRAVG